MKNLGKYSLVIDRLRQSRFGSEKSKLAAASGLNVQTAERALLSDKIQGVGFGNLCAVLQALGHTPESFFFGIEYGFVEDDAGIVRRDLIKRLNAMTGDQLLEVRDMIRDRFGATPQDATQTKTESDQDTRSNYKVAAKHPAPIKGTPIPPDRT